MLELEERGERAQDPTEHRAAGRMFSGEAVQPVAARYQGLTLVHFTAQPEPFVTLNISPKRQNTPSTTAIHTP